VPIGPPEFRQDCRILREKFNSPTEDRAGQPPSPGCGPSLARQLARILEVEEIKSIPYVPVSHPFVERLIGTTRREFLDHVLIWNAIVERKLEEFRIYYNENRIHRSLGGSTPGERSGDPHPPMPSLITTLGSTIAAIYSICQSQRNYEFATHRCNFLSRPAAISFVPSHRSPRPAPSLDQLPSYPRSMQ
jgi:hypothetical protein